MPDSILEPWRNYFLLMGSASATLVGLTFVAASVGTGVFTQERQVGLRAFLSPAIVAFSVVLATSLIGVSPVSQPLLGTLCGAIGLFGEVYSVVIWRRMVREGIHGKIDLEDRIWYTIAPVIAYAILSLAGLALIIAANAACAILAVGMGLLLLAGIRNAWDITTWVVLRRQS